MVRVMNQMIEDVEFYEPSENEEYISASRILSYEKCPRQYYYHYLTDKPEEKLDKGYAEMGTFAHEAIEEVVGDDTYAKSQSKLANELQIRFSQDQAEMDQDRYDDGVKCLQNVAKFMTQVNPKVRDVELEMDYGLTEFNQRIYGYADLVADGMVVDWKTGNYYNQGSKGSQQEWDNKIQGMAYALGYAYEYGELPENVYFVYLKTKHSGEKINIRSINPNNNNLEVLYDGLTNIIDGLKFEDYHPEPGDMCFWCDSEMVCDASPCSYNNADYTEWPL